jgi:chromosome partitioning protein
LGLSELLRHYQVIKKNGNRNLRVEGILITMDIERTIVSGQVKELLDESFTGKIPIFDTHIPRSIKVSEASGHQLTICEFIPDNPAALAYEDFAKELILWQPNYRKSS